MSEISDAIQDKCLAFGDRIIKLNDFLLEQAANKHHTSDIYIDFGPKIRTHTFKVKSP